MATREARLAEFSQSTPKENRPLQILCEDKSGTYLIPYPCQWSDGAWRKVGSAKIIEATVIGWRTRRDLGDKTSTCPLLAHSGHQLVHCKCPLSGAKRTSVWLHSVDRR